MRETLENNMAQVIFMLVNQIASVFVSLQFATVIEFPLPITSYVYGGSESDLVIDLIQNDKVLSIKPRVANINSNFVVTTKTSKYYFYLKTNTQTPHKFITIKDGLLEPLQKIIKDEKDFTFLEGETSAKIVPKTIPLEVNGEQISSTYFVPKGAPLLINGNRILN